MSTTLRFAPITERPPAIRPTTVKGWHDDPLGLHALRYHDGIDFTDHVTHFGPVPCSSCR
jgi:Protein of unknown function (DUF2510)